MQNMKKIFKTRNIILPKLSIVTGMQTETVTFLRELAESEDWDLKRANKY